MAHKTMLDRGTVRRVAVRLLRPGESVADDEAEIIVENYTMEVQHQLDREFLLGSPRGMYRHRGEEITVEMKGALVRGGELFGRSIDRGATCDCDNPDGCLHALARAADRAEATLKRR